MENIQKQDITNRACIAGAALAGACIAHALLTTIITKTSMGAFGLTCCTMLLWMAKFVGCIFLMKFFMKKLCTDFDNVSRKETYRLGVLAALFSALVIAIYNYVSLTYIHPDMMAEQMNQVMEQYRSMMDSNSIDSINRMMEGNALTIISMVSNLIYCFLYGWVLSAILSRNIPSSNPFAQTNTDEQ